METKQLENPKEINQKVQLVKGIFSPSDASYILINLIDQKINFHKIQRLQKWEGNHYASTNDLDNRITQLEKEKEKVRAFIANSRKQGSNLNINGVLELSLTEAQP